MKVNLNTKINTNPKFGSSFNLLTAAPIETRSKVISEVLLPHKASLKEHGKQLRITCPDEFDTSLKVKLYEMGINFVRAVVPKAN